MEKQPKPERQPFRGFRIEFESGEKLICHKNNTAAYIHKREPSGDHIFVFDTEEDGTISTDKGKYVFREQIAGFYDTVDKMRANGWNVYDLNKMSDSDRESFILFKRLSAEKALAREQQMRDMNDKLDESGLTPRQELRPGFLRFLLDKDLLLPEHFEGEGDLWI